MDSDSQPPSASFKHPLIGELFIISAGKGIASIAFKQEVHLADKAKLCAIISRSPADSTNISAEKLLASVIEQLNEFFERKRENFDLPIDLSLTVSEYQRRVLAEVVKIPYGTISTYGRIADKTGGTARSAGSANANNPLPIIIPCHRVIGGDGKLRGYGGGIHLKEALLRLESSRLI